MDDKPDVRFVDAHAKRDGRDNDLRFIAEKRILMRVAHLFIKPGMIGQRAKTLVPKVGRKRIDRRTAKAIDYPAFVLSFLKKIEQLAEGIPFWLDAVGNVRTVKTRKKKLGVAYL